MSTYTKNPAVRLYTYRKTKKNTGDPNLRQPTLIFNDDETNNKKVHKALL
jgi:hypothetical protein